MNCFPFLGLKKWEAVHPTGGLARRADLAHVNLGLIYHVDFGFI